MKKLLLLIACVAMSMSAMAQESQLEQIVEVKSPKSTIFINAQQWATADMAGVTKKLETSDGETGTILVNISMLTNPYLLDYTFKFNIKIDCRDNKYRTIISNPVVYIKLNSKYSNFDYLAQSTLINLRDLLKAVKDLSTYEFKGMVAWNVEEIQPVLSEKKAEVIKLESEKAGLDAKKNKKELRSINYSLTPLEQEVSVMSEILRAWSECLSNINGSLEKSLSVSNDF